jgi:F-type H+-transporting ATPase subunit gamma
MPSLKNIRTRIKAVKSTQKITRAMKMVAAARLRRAQDAIETLRPYAYRLRETVWELSRASEASDHPLLAQREPKRVQLLVLTSDRGLCGGFNTSINRATETYIREHKLDHEHMGLALIGRKGRDYFGRRPYPIDHVHRDVFTQSSMLRAQQIGEQVVADFVDQGLDAVYLVYNEFKNAISQEVRVEQLLPVIPEETADTSEAGVEFVYEPSKRAVLDSVLPLHINVQIYRAVLESVASEMGARMTAMDAATKNAGELVGRLTLEYNRARQAAITKELMEIVAGAEALR